MALTTHSPGLVSALRSPFSSESPLGGTGRDPPLCFPSHPITCVSFLQPWLYSHPPVSLQLVFSEECSVWRYLCGAHGEVSSHTCFPVLASSSGCSCFVTSLAVKPALGGGSHPVTPGSLAVTTAPGAGALGQSSTLVFLLEFSQCTWTANWASREAQTQGSSGEGRTVLKHAGAGFETNLKRINERAQEAGEEHHVSVQGKGSRPGNSFRK